MTSTVLAYLPSPSQGVWHLGPVPIRAYALCIIAGIVAALVIGDRRWAARGGEPGVIYDIALWAVPFGLVGGRLYHVMTDWRTYFGPEGKGLAAAFQVWEGGLGIWGAVALGGVGAWIACRRRDIPLPAFGDAIAPGIVLAQAIGRFGNYFNQELYGRATTLPWGLEIYDRRNAAGIPDQLNGVSNGTVLAVVHPTFLYELLWNLLVFALLIWVDRKFRIGHGRLFAIYVAAYCVGRFCVELMRSDAATHLAGIRINTFTSTFVFVGAIVYIMLAPKGREEPATLAGRRHDDTDESVIDDAGKELVGVAATTGVVAAAKVAGKSDVDVVGEPSEDMHPDQVMTDEGADAAAAVELKAFTPQADTDKEPVDEDEAVEEADEEAAAEAEEAEAAVDTDAAEREEASEAAEPAAEPEAEDVAIAEETVGAAAGDEGEFAETEEPAIEAVTAEPEAEEPEPEDAAVVEKTDEATEEPAAETATEEAEAESEDVAAGDDSADADETESSAAEDDTVIEESDEAAASDEGEAAEPAETEQPAPETEDGEDVTETEEPATEAVAQEPEVEESEAADAAETTDEGEEPAAETATEAAEAESDEPATEAVAQEPEVEESEAEDTVTEGEPATEQADETADSEPEADTETDGAASTDEAPSETSDATEGAESDAAEGVSEDSTPAEADEPAEPETSQSTPVVPSKPAAPALKPERRRWWRRRR